MIFNSVVLGSDHAGYSLKLQLIDYIHQYLDLKVIDIGPYDDQPSPYPIYAHQVAKYMQDHPQAMGCLICGTGMGMCITVNRYDHIRGALCNDALTTVATARAHNNANVLCLGGRINNINFATQAIKIFATTAFEGGRHQARIDLINNK